jgi:upstream activation factor subunit UAF30
MQFGAMRDYSTGPWVPAFAGMTVLGVRVQKNSRGRSPSTAFFHAFSLWRTAFCLQPRLSLLFNRKNFEKDLHERQNVTNIGRCVYCAFFQCVRLGGSKMATAKKTTAAPAKKAAAKPAAKPAAKKAAPAKAAPKAAAAKKPAARKPNAAFMKAMTPSAQLAAVVGSNPLPRTEVTKKVWEYIKKQDLQDAANRRMINADDKLKPVFGGKSQVSMFEMTKLISDHLK